VRPTVSEMSSGRSTQSPVIGRQQKEESGSENEGRKSDGESSYCSSNDLEPEWLDDIQKNGELFYLELSEGEEDLALTRANAHQQVSTNHVRFSEKEAEILTEQHKKQHSNSRAKGTATLKRLAKILRRKRRSTLRKGKDVPASILKNQSGQRHGGTVQKQLKEVCVYLNPKRLSALSVPLFEDGGLLEALLGVIHRPSWDSDGMRREDRLTIHGLVPNTPAAKCGDILIGDVLVAMDDVDVNSENIERVLSCIPGPTQVSGNSLYSYLFLFSFVFIYTHGLESHLKGHHATFLEEILYQYPVSEASRQLKGVRGIFLTLCDMLENVTGGQILSSSLLLGKHLVHVGYWKENNNLLVIGLPAESGEFVTYHTPRLDHFFCLFFQQLIQPSRLREGHPVPPMDTSGTLFLDGLPAVRWLTLPPEIKSEDYFGLRRMYVILGSCLFYKSYLIANHLPKEDLLDVSLYCQHYLLLPLSWEQRVGQLVVWREVFPQQRATAAPGFNTPQGRYFLLIVGLRHFMQCVLLEAGGCASPAVGCPGPDSVYVDQVKATLLQLEELEGSIEERLSAPPAPCLSCADWFLPSSSSSSSSSARERLDSLASSSPVLSKLVKSSSSPGYSPRKHPNPFHLGTLKKTLTERETDDMYNTKLSSGPDNTLFHFLLMDSVRGVFIAPSHRDVSLLSGSIHPQLITNFHHCCLSIRHAFRQSLPAKVRPKATGLSGGWGLGPVKEHGVLFQCTPPNWTDQKKPPPTMTYWVIGRMLLEPIPQEFYVCFHDSVPEVPVEMAFRLSFGLNL
uniref:Protein inturned n=1 Tax=Periophthalmus magnuspinnatus TaxID=409849 RepID=A0A3B4AFX5_9GOBI